MTIAHLQAALNWYTGRGWTITSATDQIFTATKKNQPGLGIWLIAIIFFPIGLLAFLVDRGVESVAVTAEQAESHLLLAQERSASASKASGRAALVVLGLVLLIGFLCALTVVLGN